MTLWLIGPALETPLEVTVTIVVIPGAVGPGAEALPCVLEAFDAPPQPLIVRTRHMHIAVSPINRRAFIRHINRKMHALRVPLRAPNEPILMRSTCGSFNSLAVVVFEIVSVVLAGVKPSTASCSGAKLQDVAVGSPEQLNERIPEYPSPGSGVISTEALPVALLDTLTSPGFTEI